MRNALRALVLFVAFTLVIPHLARAATPAIYNLGTLGGTASWGADINDSGQVTGTSYTIGNGSPHAFLYTGAPGSGGAMHDLGVLGGSESYGSAINNAGQVAGSSTYAAGNLQQQAFLYTGTPGNGGVMGNVGFCCGITSYARGINNSGQIVGGTYSSLGDPGVTYAFYTAQGSSGVMEYYFLGTLGGDASYGRSINDHGQIAGDSEYTTGSFATHAFLHSGMPGSGDMLDLGTLGGASSRAFAINNSGQVAGQSETVDNRQHAFLYTGTLDNGGVMHDLGTLGGYSSVGYDVNASGQVVGESGTANGQTHAFVYIGTPGVGGQMIDLDAWLDANNPAEGAKWTLEWASGLNDTGLITGRGYYDDGRRGLSDGYRAFLLDASSLLPEPSADFNGDGSIDGADLQKWQGDFGQNPYSDVDNDGDSDGADFLVWQRQLGSAGPAMSTNAPVPEPSSLALLGLAVPALLLRTRTARVHDRESRSHLNAPRHGGALTPTKYCAAPPALLSLSAAPLLMMAVVVWCGLAASSPAAIVHYGNDVPFPEESDSYPNYLLGSKYTVTQPIVLQKAGIIFNGFAITNAKVGVYTDAGGAPNTLVAETGSFEVYFDSYLETPLLTTPTIPAGDYWFMAVFDAQTSVYATHDVDTQAAYIAHTFNAPLPATFPVPNVYTGVAFNYYLVGETTISTVDAGDFNHDGAVDGADFLAWQRGESPGPLSSIDLTDWQTHFGTGPGMLAATSVPEPAAGALALLGVSNILLYRRRSL